MNSLQTGIIDVSNKDLVYEPIMDMFNNKKISFANGKKKNIIEHGDYGYFEHEKENIPRLFLKTNRNKIEAFCVKPFHHKCSMGADVNKNPEQYFIVGNLFAQNSL